MRSAATERNPTAVVSWREEYVRRATLWPFVHGETNKNISVPQGKRQPRELVKLSPRIVATIRMVLSPPARPVEAPMADARVVSPVHAALIVVEGMWVWYRRNWRATVVSSVVQPVLFLVALGFGLGSQIQPAAATDGVEYAVYLAPALLVAASVQIATFESTYPVLSAFRWRQTYFGIAASPITPGQIFGGHLIWVGL